MPAAGLLNVLNRAHAVDFWSAATDATRVSQDVKEFLKKNGIKTLPGCEEACSNTLNDMRQHEMLSMRALQPGTTPNTLTVADTVKDPALRSAITRVKTNLEEAGQRVASKKKAARRPSGNKGPRQTSLLRSLSMDQLQALPIRSQNSNDGKAHGNQCHPLHRSFHGSGWHLKPAHLDASEWSGLICCEQLPRYSSDADHARGCHADTCAHTRGAECVPGCIAKGTPQAAFPPLPWPWKIKCKDGKIQEDAVTKNLYFDGDTFDHAIRYFTGSPFLPSRDTHNQKRYEEKIYTILSTSVWHYISLNPIDEFDAAVQAWRVCQGAWPNVLAVGQKESSFVDKIMASIPLKPRSSDSPAALAQPGMEDALEDGPGPDAAHCHERGGVLHERLKHLMECKVAERGGKKFESVDWFAVLPANAHGPWEEMARAMAASRVLPTPESRSTRYVKYHYENTAGKECPPEFHERMIVPGQERGGSRTAVSNGDPSASASAAQVRNHKQEEKAGDWLKRFKNLKEMDIRAKQNANKLFVVVCAFQTFNDQQEEAKKVAEFFAGKKYDDHNVMFVHLSSVAVPGVVDAVDMEGTNPSSSASLLTGEKVCCCITDALCALLQYRTRLPRLGSLVVAQRDQHLTCWRCHCVCLDPRARSIIWRRRRPKIPKGHTLKMT